MKTPLPTEKFAIEYLCENEKVHKTVFIHIHFQSWQHGYNVAGVQHPQVLLLSRIEYNIFNKKLFHMFTYFSDLKSLFCEFMTENLPYNRDVVEYLWKQNHENITQQSYTKTV